MSIIWDVKSIRRKLERQEQKAEFDEKNPPVDLGMYGYPSNLTPLADGYGKSEPFCAKTNLRNILGELKTELSLLERLYGAVVKS